MTDRVVDLAAGTQVWFEGAVWVVRELGPSAVTLSCGQSLRAVAMTQLACQVVVMSADPGRPDDEELVDVVLSSLGPKERAALERRGEQVRELLGLLEASGSGSGSHYEAKAADLGVSVRTLKRWVSAYRDAGVAGLADSRLLGR